MNFSDRLIFRICSGLAEGHFPGLRLAANLLALARDNGLLPVANLDTLSLVQVQMTCPFSSPPHQAARAEFLGRGLSPLDSWAALHEALRPDLTDFHAAAYHGEPSRRALVESAYAVLYVPSLAIFLSRIALIEMNEALMSAKLRLHEVFPHIEPALPNAGNAPSREDGLLVGVYARELQSGRRIPESLEESDPQWLDALPAEEQRFLEVCWGELDPELRCLLFLSFYGELNVRHITLVLQQAGAPNCTPNQVARSLHSAWSTVLKHLPHA